ncbi:MAG TPA: YncE family protein, partial [Thermodesulfovibrionales bacterium]|nr:YncE family protein [Thermodesulfovibrionales bacterium]
MRKAARYVLIVILAFSSFYSVGHSSDREPGQLVMGPSHRPSDITAHDDLHHEVQREIRTIPGMPSVIDPSNIYSEISADKLDPALKHLPPRVYVPNEWEGTVTVIDPKTFNVIERFHTGKGPQHVVPSWDKKRLWVVNNESDSLTPIDAATGKPGTNVHVTDPYNMYFTPDGKYAIVVAEARHRLDFRDPQTMDFRFSLDTTCRGINHMDFSMDGRYAIISCEFGGEDIKVDMVKYRPDGSLNFGLASMPQDVRLSSDGRIFYVADMVDNGVHLVDGDTLT